MPPDQPHPDDERVSRLLADARHTEPLPVEVAARLDRTLADLAAERPSPAEPVAPVVDLAARRRRRLATGLVAAAAVVALGVSLPNLHLTGSPVGDSASSADSAADQDSSALGGQSRELASSEADSSGEPSSSAEAGEAGEPAAPLATPAEVRPGRFNKDVEAAREGAFDTSLTVCGDLPPGAEQVVPVRYADREGYLVFAAAQGDRQAVTLYLCPGGEPARRTVVAAP
jgi:hypothetical protein